VSLPSNLSPPLAKVPNEYSSEGCINSPTATKPTPEFTCVRGDLQSKRVVVLFGDSHAWQWTVPLTSIARARKWKLITYTMGGCPAEDFVFFDPSTNTEDTQCESFRNAVFAKLRTLRPAVVIMSSYTQFAASPQSMTKTIDTLKQDGSRVVWLEDTPYPGFNVPDCLSVNPTDIQKCSFTLKTGLKYPGVRASLNSAAAHDGALIVNPVPWFCTRRICPAVVGTSVTFFDESHVTRSYAQTLTPLLSRALAPALTLPGPGGPSAS
jgi:SGNH domain (fused to AT3 domains)